MNYWENAFTVSAVPQANVDVHYVPSTSEVEGVPK